MDFTECYEDTVSSVAAAARVGCRRRLRTLIRRGGSVDCRDNRGWNALHEAAAAGSAECVREILSAARDSFTGIRSYVNSLTHVGESACYLAAQHGHLTVVRLLLRAHADIDRQTNDLSCAIYEAVKNRHTDVVELLVRRGAELNRTHTEYCWTCLHQAVYKGYSDIVRILVDKCSLEVVDDNGITPLFVAAQKGKLECLEILINAGGNVNAQAADLATPLMIAAHEGHEACVELLLEHGADPNLTCTHGWPQLPIHAATQFGHISILKRLIAVTDRACDRGEGMVSPLYMAIHCNRSESMETLLSEGYSPHGQDCTRFLGVRSPLALALDWTSDKPGSNLVKLLVAAGARFNEEDWLYVVATDRRDLLQTILEHRWIPRPEALNSDCSVPQHHGKTALTLQEVKELLCVALNNIRFAGCWLPLLLKAGLEPSLLLQPVMLKKADSEVLNYLLEFVNWSALSTRLKKILDRRLAEKTWEPRPYFDSVPSLSHICRLEIRTALGPDRLMRTNVVEQLPVPAVLHDFLNFRDIPEASYTHSRPLSILNRRLQYRGTSDLGGQDRGRRGGQCSCGGE